MKFLPVEAESFHADGQPGMTKLIVAFLNFSKAPKISAFSHTVYLYISLFIQSAATISLHIINLLISVMEKQYVYSEVRTWFLTAT